MTGSDDRINKAESRLGLIEHRLSQIEKNQDEQKADHKAERSWIFRGLLGVIAMQIWNLISNGGGPGFGK